MTQELAHRVHIRCATHDQELRGVPKMVDHLNGWWAVDTSHLYCPGMFDEDLDHEIDAPCWDSWELEVHKW